jgi:peptidyl-prolyl cis-trans isomerase SurA
MKLNKNLFHIICCIILSICYTNESKAQEQSYGDRIIAKIGKSRIILASELEQHYQQFLLENSSEANDNMKCQLLQEMIFQKILAEQADRDSVIVSDDEVDANMDQRIRYFVSRAGSQERLEQEMGKTIYQMKDENREMIKETMVADRMKMQIIQGVKITPIEVKKYFDKIPTDSLPYLPASVEIGQIVIEPPVSPEMDHYARTTIDEIRKAIVEQGADFETQAAMKSVDPGSRDQGGDLGWVEKGQMVPEFEKAAFRLQIGEISPIVKSDFGYHIIQCVGQKGEKYHLRHILIRQERTTADFKAAMTKLDSLRAELMANKTTYQIAVGKYSTDKQSKMTGGMITDPRTGSSRMQVSDLDPAMALAIEGLSAGQFSQPQIFVNPQTGEKSSRIIYLKSKSEPHKANLQDDYGNIMEVALQQKQMDKQNKWLEEKLPTFYIKIDMEYHSCEILKPWIAVINQHNK